ncbi:restriction endonuclease subunit S, partial [Flavobacteriaceae bacterium]|nr:restriction endonuclease subunit S [Flavobacteriaceae bacterium]
TKILGEVCEILDNLRKPITKRDRIEGKYPYYGATGILSYINDYIFDEKLVLIGEDGAKWFSGANSSFIVNGKYWVNNHAHVIRPNRTIILDEWIVYFLNFSDLEEFVTGMTVPKLNQGNLKIIPIPLPPLTQQKQIVATLDKAFAAIDTAKANAGQNLKNAKELFESYLQNIFESKGDGWEIKIFDDVINFSQIGLVRNNKEQSSEYTYRYLKMNNINNDNGLNEDSFKFVNATSEEVKKYQLLNDDFLFNTRNSFELVGKNCLYKSDYTKPTLFNNNILRVRFNDFLFPEFAAYAFSSKAMIDNLEKIKSGTTNVVGIYYKSLKYLEIPIPPLPEQKQIVQKLDLLSLETKKMEAIYTQKIADLEEMKKSILQKAFSGQLNT